MTACPSLQTGGAFLANLLTRIDCQGRTIGSLGFQSLADPSSPTSLALTSLLTIFIAILGLRLILGDRLGLRDSVTAALKVGVVLLLATSWPAYRTVVYDVVVRGPAELTSAVLAPTALPGARGDLVQRAQIVDRALVRLTTLGSGRTDLTARAQAGAAGQAASERAPVSDDIAFGAARVFFLSTLVGAFAAVRLTAGVLLALAPLFAGLLLFDVGRGLFVGWARGLVFTIVASVATSVIVAVELSLLEPWLSSALQLRAARLIAADAPVEVLVLALGFALALAGALAVIARLAFTLDVSTLRPSSRVSEGLALLGGNGSAATSGWERFAHRSVGVVSSQATIAAADGVRAQAYAAARIPQLASAGAPAVAAPAPRSGPPSNFTAPTARRTRPRATSSASLRDRRS